MPGKLTVEKIGFPKPPFKKKQPWGKKPSKHRNVSTFYTDIHGTRHWFQSRAEANYAAKLDTLIIGGAIQSWQKQVKIPMDVQGLHICNYYCDFKLTHNDGSVEWVEVKGRKTDVFNIKWRLFEALYPDWSKRIEWV